MSSAMLDSLREEFDRLSAALDRPLEGPERAAVRAAIVALFKRTESAIGELAEFKEGIRDLVNRVKALPESAPPASVHHDHLGASTFLERSWSELAAGNWSAAETMLRQAIALDATSANAQALLGWALMHQGRLEEAVQPCARVLQRDPDHGLARVGMGAICLRKGMADEAVGHLTRAAAHAGDPRAALYANYWLGVAHVERDRFADAVESLRHAVTLGPNLAEGWVELGRALWFDRHHAEAREAWMVGAGIRHSPHAARCTALLHTVSAGGTPPRSSFT
jgi:tetratricopeptide (TPR) repeat protein